MKKKARQIRKTKNKTGLAWHKINFDITNIIREILLFLFTKLNFQDVDVSMHIHQFYVSHLWHTLHDLFHILYPPHIVNPWTESEASLLFVYLWPAQLGSSEPMSGGALGWLL